jgi:hypothetical protein
LVGACLLLAILLLPLAALRPLAVAVIAASALYGASAWLLGGTFGRGDPTALAILLEQRPHLFHADGRLLATVGLPKDWFLGINPYCATPQAQICRDPAHAAVRLGLPAVLALLVWAAWRNGRRTQLGARLWEGALLCAAGLVGTSLFYAPGPEA